MSRIASYFFILVVISSTLFAANIEFFHVDIGSRIVNHKLLREKSFNPHLLISDNLWDQIRENYSYKVLVKVLAKNKKFLGKLVEGFEFFGGDVLKTWQDIGVFMGRINVLSLTQYVSMYSKFLSFVEPGYYKVKQLLDVSTKLIRVANVVWNTYGFRGDPDSAIAIIDTGIDDSHPMTANYSNLGFGDPNVKIVGWYDAVYGTSSPSDYGGHGTHVASIAAGYPYSGDPDGDGLFEIFFALDNYDLPAGTYDIPIGFFVNYTGLLNVSVLFSSTKVTLSSIRLENPSGSIVKSDNSEPFVITYNITDPSEYGYWRLVARVTSTTGGSINLKVYFEKEFNGGKIFSGVAPDVKIVAVRGLGGTISDLIDAILWVANNAETYHIIACVNSWVIVDQYGNPTRDLSVERAIGKMIRKGIVVVAAAGNFGDTAPYGEQIGTPANMDYVIAVGATDEHLRLTSYSSRGPGIGSNISKPDILAPGGILSEGAISAADTNDVEGVGSEVLNDLVMYQGTSMAAPHIGGLAMLIAQALGGYASWDYNPLDLTNSKSFLVKMVLLMTAWEIDSFNGWVDYREGFGFVQGDAAIEAVTKIYNVGEIVSGYLDGRENLFGKHVWARKVSLTAGETYDFYLYQPSDANFDLYLFYPTPDKFGRPRLAAYSNSTTAGAVEHINFVANETGEYYIVVKEVSGSGNFVLSTTEISGVKPAINIISPANGEYVNYNNVLVTWSAFDKYGLDYFEILLNNSLIASIPAKYNNYTISLPSDGAWEIKVVAYNIFGNYSEDKVIIYLDRRPPTLEFLNIKNHSVILPGNFTIRWVFSDNFGIKQILLSIDGGATINVTNMDSFETVFEEGDHVIRFYVEDLAGNWLNITIFFKATTVIRLFDREELPIKGPPMDPNIFKYILIGIVAIYATTLLLYIAYRKKRS